MYADIALAGRAFYYQLERLDKALDRLEQKERSLQNLCDLAEKIIEAFSARLVMSAPPDAREEIQHEAQKGGAA